MSHLHAMTFENMISYHQISFPSASSGEIQTSLHFSEHSIGREKKNIVYSLVNSEITTLCIRPIFSCMVLFWIFNNEPVSKVSKRIHVWNLIRYKVHPNFLSRRQFLCAPFSSTIQVSCSRVKGEFFASFLVQSSYIFEISNVKQYRRIQKISSDFSENF